MRRSCTTAAAALGTRMTPLCCLSTELRKAPSRAPPREMLAQGPRRRRTPNMTVEQTLAELVAIDSVSANSNAEIVSYLQKRCEALGFRIQRFPHVDEQGVEKINLVGQTSVWDSQIAGSQTEVCATELALVGHTDTVPYDLNWTEALTLTERDGKLFGRGACDTKAFIAAALTALESIDVAKLRKPLALVFTADEDR